MLVAVDHGQLRLFITINLIYNPLDFLMYQVLNLPSATINGTHKTMYAKLPQYLAVRVDRMMNPTTRLERQRVVPIKLHLQCDINVKIRILSIVQFCAVALHVQYNINFKIRVLSVVLTLKYVFSVYCNFAQ